ncbi:pitrilysin family protein [Myxococcus sp. CA040A]|nr:pitrilysin family protein [Myxococcus sp. CA040A]NTX02889.1 insulinase family protein [Myxococcus sp. CA040A]
MSFLRSWLLLCCALGSTLALAAAPIAPLFHAELLQDGTELVVLSRPESATASLRLVVRSGSSRDPSGKEGLAHLLEHLVFQGSQDVPGKTLRASIDTAGGTLNAFTSARSTVYALDTPGTGFLPLARDVLRMVTSPTLPGGKRLERELGIITTEGRYHFSRQSLASQVEEAMFQDITLEGALIGTPATRARITREDLQEYYARNYVTSNVSLVFTGAVSVEQARALVEEAYRLPPALPEEAVAPAMQSAQYPVVQQTRAHVTFVTLGYPVPHEERATCRAVASLLQLRLLQQVHVEEPIVSAMRVLCLNLRGNDLLLAFAYTRSIEGSRLPYLMQETFDALAKKPPSAAERKLLEKRGQRTSERWREAGPEVADAVASQAAEPRLESLTDLGFLQPPPIPTSAQLKDFARRHFVEEQAVRITSSPLEG